MTLNIRTPYCVVSQVVSILSLSPRRTAKPLFPLSLCLNILHKCIILPVLFANARKPKRFQVTVKAKRPWLQVPFAPLPSQDGDVALSFRMRRAHGQWDDYVKWPFSRRITIVITHLRDRAKDIRLPIRNSGHDYFKKPAPREWNKIMNTGDISWRTIEHNGFIFNKTLYVHVEFD
ncbi:hypothetical protein MRX96_000350 [Rhipicephalus microplus]